MRKWLKITLFGLVILLCVLLGAGIVFERVSRVRANRIKPTGYLVETGDHQLHYVKRGTGGPTVIFESGLDPSGHLQWYHIQQEVSTLTTTISYDRAGILWSERGRHPKTGGQIAEELHALLQKINAPKPYILVGHSLGAVLNRSFVSKYPRDIAGIIWIDAQNPDDKNHLSPQLYSMVNQGLPEGFLKFANATGLARLLFKHMFPDKPEYGYQNTIMPSLIHKSAYGVLEESDLVPLLKEEASGIRAFGAIPLILLSATDTGRYNSFIKDQNLRTEMLEAWSKMQKDLQRLSTNSRQIAVDNSGHYIHLDRPDVIIREIEDLLRQIKEGEPYQQQSHAMPHKRFSNVDRLSD